MFREADIGLSRYRNIIGIGVIVMFIVFSGIFLYTYSQERKIAEKCGFEDEKIKCVCTKQAWDNFNTKNGWNLEIPLSLNTNCSSIKQDNGEQNNSTIKT